MDINLLVQDTFVELQKEFYSTRYSFSYSSLKKLLFSPVSFYSAYIIKQKEEEQPTLALLQGKVIHCLLLDKSSFNKQYVISPYKIPTAQTKFVIDKIYSKNKAFISELSELDEFKDDILEILKNINYFQSVKSDEDKLKKIITEENKSYFNFLVAKDRKEVIDYDTLKYCNDSVDIVRSYPEIVELLGLDDDELSNTEVYNELYMGSTLDTFPFDLKGIIDNLKIDHNKKTININDFKTTSKSLKEFKDSVEFYSYWMQAAIYLVMVLQKYAALIKEGYTYHFNFIVIDKYYNVYVFPVSYETQIEWFSRLDESLEIARYHYDNKRFELPYEFDIKAVVL